MYTYKNMMKSHVEDKNKNKRFSRMNEEEHRQQNNKISTFGFEILAMYPNWAINKWAKEQLNLYRTLYICPVDVFIWHSFYCFNTEDIFTYNCHLYTLFLRSTAVFSSPFLLFYSIFTLATKKLIVEWLMLFSFEPQIFISMVVIIVVP